MKRLLYAVIAPLLILLIWKTASSMTLVSPYLLPGPEKVWRTCLDMISSGELFRNIRSSLWRVAQGFAISAFFGALLAWMLANMPKLEKILDPVFNFLRMTPPLATIPLLILWFGIGEGTQLAIIILAAFFPIFLNARAGFASLKDSYKELAKSLNLSRWDYVRYFSFPAAFPAIVTGFRLSFGYSWRALIAAELIAASSGLGYMIADAEQMQRVDVVIVGIFAIGLIGWLLDSGFRFLIDRCVSRRFPELAWQ